MKKIVIVALVLSVVLLSTFVLAAGWRIHLSKPVASCRDSDGGLVEDVSGKVVFKRSLLGRVFALKDYCKGNVVHEFQCTQEGEKTWVQMWRADCRELGFEGCSGARCRAS